MKKNLLIVLTLVCSLCLGTKTAYAAPSPTAEDTTILAEAVKVDTETGTAEALGLDIITDANNAARQLVADIIAKAQTSTEGVVSEDGTLVLAEDGTPLGTSAEPELLAAFDFTPAESVKAEIEKKGKVSVTFEVEDVKSGDCVKLLHFLEAKNEWETIDPTSVKDGKVTATFTSFSPIVIVKLTPEVAKLDNQAKGANIYVIIAISLIAIAAIAVVFAFGNKQRLVKKVNPTGATKVQKK